MINSKSMYGVYNTVTKEFQFGISEPSPQEARTALFNRIGKDAFKWRFEFRKIPDGVNVKERKNGVHTSSGFRHKPN